MKTAQLLSLVLTISGLAGAQAPYPTISYQFWGARTVFAGHSSWYMYVPKWAVPVTCNPATSKCAAAGHQFKGGERAYFNSLGKAPAGILTLFGGNLATYAVCDVAGNSFSLREGSCSGAVQTFKDAGVGAQNVLVDLGLTVFITSVRGFPAGTVLNWYWMDTPGIRGPLPASSGVPYSSGGYYEMALEARIPANAATGNYNPSVTIAQDAIGTNPSTLSWTIAVVPSPAAPAGPPTYVPAIPNLSGWQSEMISTHFGGAEWCTNPAHPTEVFSFTDEGQVWYYDGARVYFNMANSTGNLLWRNCGHNIASQYADWVIASGGAVPGWRMFPHGLAMAAVLYPAETKFKKAVDLLRTNGLFTPLGGRIDDDLLRETAYAVDVYTVTESMLGEPRHPNLQRSSEFLMGMLLAYTDGTSRYSQYQTFYCGLAMEALINYWELTKDTRVPFVVHRMLNDIWFHYDLTQHAIAYDPDPVGPHCSNVSLWYADGGGDCGIHNVTFQILHNLAAPAFAWYWQITGNDNYRILGDELFRHALDNGPYSGKQFSQAYRWSFDFVKVRTAPAQPF